MTAGFFQKGGMDMKKLLAILLPAVLALTACQKQSAFNEEEFLNEIKPNVEVLNSCNEEMFGAEVDFNTSYLAAYADEAAYADGSGDIIALFAPEDEAEYAKQYYIDPTYCDFYPVGNFKTNDDVKGYLSQYLSEELVDKYFQDDFLEYDGTLYLRRGARGYGAITVDLDSLKYLEERDAKQYASVDFLYFGDYDYTSELEFVKNGDGWILNSLTDGGIVGTGEFDQQKLLNEIKPNIERLNSCIEQTFGAEVDFDTAYMAAYSDEASYNSGTDGPAALFPPEDEEKYAEQYYIAPDNAVFYPVSNFKSNEEVRSYLREYMSDTAIDTYFHDDFLEYEGSLYLVRGDRDYPETGVDLNSVKYLEEKDGKQYVSVAVLFFGEYNGTLGLELTQNSNRWIINDVFPVVE